MAFFCMFLVKECCEILRKKPVQQLFPRKRHMTLFRVFHVIWQFEEFKRGTTRKRIVHRNNPFSHLKHLFHYLELRMFRFAGHKVQR